MAKAVTRCLFSDVTIQRSNASRWRSPHVKCFDLTPISAISARIVVSLRHSRIHAHDCEECLTEDGMIDRIDIGIELTGPGGSAIRPYHLRDGF